MDEIIQLKTCRVWGVVKVWDAGLKKATKSQKCNQIHDDVVAIISYEKHLFLFVLLISAPPVDKNDMNTTACILDISKRKIQNQ